MTEHATAPTSSPDAGTDPLARLRAATAQLHAELDAGLPLARDRAGPRDYQQHLALLRTWVGLLRDGGARLALLDEEAAALDAELAECERVTGRRAPVIAVPAAAQPALEADGADWGLAYVLQGSRLGGQVLYKRLAQAMAPLRLGYLQGAGGATGARWKAFVAQLKTELADQPARTEAAVQAARQAFELLLACHRAMDGGTVAPARH